MQGIIYIHRNKINGKCYVGQTIQKPKMRWLNGAGYIECPKFYRAIIKYGWDNFEHLILSDIYTTQEELNAAEIATISKYDSFNDGYNATAGGDNFGIEPWNKGKKYPGKFSKGGTWENGHEPWNKGLSGQYTLSEETKRKIGASQKGRTVSEETGRKISEAKKGHTVSEETREKIRQTLLARKNKALS